MKVLIKYDDGDVINDVYFAELKDGKIAIKWDLNSDYVKIVTKTKFEKMKKDANVILKELEDVNFNSHENIYKNLANRLAIAYGSYSLDVSMPHFANSYHKEENLSEFWYTLAENLDNEMGKRMSLMLENNRENK